MQSELLPPLISIVGPTASGKTRWGIEISKHIGGEIVSADSRQVYRHMNIGTAKEPGVWKYRFSLPPYRAYVSEDVSHHIIDCIDPAQAYTVAQFQQDAGRVISAIHRRGHIPLIVGGTGLYIQSVVDNYQIPNIPPNNELRASLETKSTEFLLTQLTKVNPDVAAIIGIHNRRRIIRAIEVATEPQSTVLYTDPTHRILQIGIHIERDILYTRINNRVDAMIQAGLIQEIEMLLMRGYTWDSSSMSSVGYGQFRPYFEHKASLESCIDAVKRDTRRYAKRQLTWFRRDTRIHWCSHVDEAKLIVQSFLT